MNKHSACIKLILAQILLLVLHTPLNRTSPPFVLDQARLVLYTQLAETTTDSQASPHFVCRLKIASSWTRWNIKDGVYAWLIGYTLRTRTTPAGQL